MDDNNEISKYIKKINFIISNGFKFFDCSLVKKNRIDDVLCCFFASLPNEYKHKIELGIKQEQSGLQSVDLYHKYVEELHKQFILNKEYCIVNLNRINKISSELCNKLNSDIEFLLKSK